MPASVQAEFNWLQSVIEGLQKELSAFWSGHAVQFSGVEDDDNNDMVVDLRHKKSKVGPKTPLAITGAHQPLHRFSTATVINSVPSVGFEHVRNSRYGLRGVRVGEASNPGPNCLRHAGSLVGSRVLSTRPTVVDSESDVDDERLPVGAVPEDVIVALESDLCSESLVVVGDTDDAASVHDRTSGIPSGVQGPGSIRMSHAASDSHFRGWRGEHAQF